MEADQKFARRTRRYWMVDGLAELVMGSFFLLGGVLQLVSFVAPSNIRGFATILIPLLMMFGILVSRFGLHKVKARLTYPRSGYVEYRQPKRWQQMLGVLVGFGVGFALMPLLFNVQFSAAWLPIISGVAFALLMVGMGFYMGTARFYTLALFTSVLGILLYFLRINGFLGASLVIALTGVWLLVAGGITLRRYLQQTQVEEQ